ncbi:SpoIID/LytB domain-containing protein [Neobacillus mesonae]|uniref:SpoIID/LytB domain-containing protein n=1 Tax=Neobacillus mesonae TaxID=1193713 RepID=UPI00203BB16C|nr:SpoIID/LytB domain-containing protein [Neobacillus mesonae]MCM3567661.1 SpoIID/LytB domain-containing protein [Neobacillus mesonae]
MKKSAASLLAIILLFSILLPGASAQNIEPIVKVKLVNYLGNQSVITLKPSGDYFIQETNTRLVNGKNYTLKYETQDQLSLFEGNTVLAKADQIHLIPLTETNNLSINNRPYLGSFQFIPESSKYVRPINEVYMEDYLKGVVPYEMMDNWNREALKAQAVAARTYALLRNNRVIDDTINFQVYAGYKWLPNSTAAVEETQGEVIKIKNYKGDWVLGDGLFSASNGGKTESNANVWGGTALSYFPVKEDPFDIKANIKWGFTVEKKQIDTAQKIWSQMSETALSTTPKGMRPVTDSIKAWMSAQKAFAGNEIKITGIPVLKLHTPTSGGRVSKGDITVEFITKDKVDQKGIYLPQKLVYTNVPASQIRAMVGLDKMWSYLVSETKETNDSITLSGLGNGHGVGLSQWGAQKRAEAGQKYTEILAFYYPGTSFEKEYSARPSFTAPKVSEPAGETPSQPAQDVTPPIISAVNINVDNAKNKAKITFAINEAVKVTLYIKDSTNKKEYVLENSPANAGTFTKEIDLSSMANGKYFAGIIAADDNNNRASALPSFEVKHISAPVKAAPAVNKPVPVKAAPIVKKTVPVKDKIAPKITSTKAIVDNIKYRASISFTTNEAAYITITIKDSKGKTIKTIKNNVYTKAGAIKQDYSTAATANGKYSAAITAADKSKNRSSVTTSFTVKKAAKTKTGKVTAYRLYMRSSASTKGKVVLTLKKNQTVTILSTSGSWYKVKYGSKTGYVSKKYIK